MNIKLFGQIKPNGITNRYRIELAIKAIFNDPICHFFPFITQHPPAIIHYNSIPSPIPFFYFNQLLIESAKNLMKIYISTKVEGIEGIALFEQFPALNGLMVYYKIQIKKRTLTKFYCRLKALFIH